MSHSQSTSRVTNNFSPANLLGFSANRAYLTKSHSWHRESFLCNTQIILEDKNSEEYDDSLPRKPSMGIKSYMDQLRKSYQHSTISFAGPDRRRKKLRMIIILKWILLVLSIIGGASFGPFMLYVQTTPALKGAWKMEITLILLLPFIIYEKVHDKHNEFFRLKVLFNRLAVQKLAIASVGNALWMICLLISLNYTSMAHAYLFNGIPSLLIIIWRKLKG